MKAKTVVVLAFAAGLLAGSAPAAMTHTAATLDTRAMILAEILPESCTYATTPGDGGNGGAGVDGTETTFGGKATPQPVTFVKLANGLIWVKVAVPAIDSLLLWKVACPKL